MMIVEQYVHSINSKHQRPSLYENQPQIRCVTTPPLVVITRVFLGSPSLTTLPAYADWRYRSINV